MSQFPLILGNIVLNRIGGASRSHFASVTINNIWRIAGERMGDFAGREISLRIIEKDPTPLLLDRTFIHDHEVDRIVGVRVLRWAASSATTMPRASSFVSMRVYPSNA